MINGIKKLLIYTFCILLIVTIGMIYVAIRVKPITITYLGRDYKVKTLANTFKGAVKSMDIYFDDSFTCYPDLNSYIKKGQNIVITKKEEVSKLQLDTSDLENIKVIKMEEIKTTLEYEKESIENAKLTKGKTNVLQAGVNGEKTLIYKTVYSGNDAVDRILMYENVVEPVKEIVEVGSKIENKIQKNEGITTQQSDLDILAKVIYAEARGEPYLGQVAVGAVIVNRVRSSRFPNSIYDVVYAPGQFCTVRDGQINLNPSSQAYRAAQEAINGVDPSNGSLYFYNPKTSTSAWIFSRPVLAAIGNHNFAK